MRFARIIVCALALLTSLTARAGNRFELPLHADGTVPAGPRTMWRSGEGAVNVEGHFNAGGSHTFAYYRRSGIADLYGPEVPGPGHQILGPLGSWTTLVTFNPGPPPPPFNSLAFPVYDAILFYDKGSGALSVGYPMPSPSSTDLPMLPVPLGPRAGWDIITYLRDEAEDPQFFFYDRDTGDAQLVTLQLRNGAWSVTSRTNFTALRRTWTDIVGGIFGASARLFFYDASTGEGQFYSRDLITPTANLRGLRTSWTAILPTARDTDGKNGLLFYDAGNGDIEVYRSTVGGSIALLKVFTDPILTPNWPWTQISALDQVGTTLLCFYESRNPLIFIPGALGSRLRVRHADGSSHEAWLACGSDRSELMLDPDKPRPADVFASDILGEDTCYGKDVTIYQESPLDKHTEGDRPLLNFFLQSGGYSVYDAGESPGEPGSPRKRTFAGCDHSQRWPNLFPFPYDWRESIDVAAVDLNEYIACIFELQPGATRVDIVAHSMGNLVARKYTLLNRDSHRIAHHVSLAAPWLGAPKAIWTLETGDLVPPGHGLGGLVTVYAITPEDAKALVEFSQASHQLLPSAAYFQLGEKVTGFRTPIVEFEFGNYDYNRNGRIDDKYSYAEYTAALDLNHPRSKPGTTLDAFHGDPEQDDFRGATYGVKYLHIIGLQRGRKTIKSVAFGVDADCSTGEPFVCGTTLCLVCGVPILDKWALLGLGDGTVPFISASRTPEDLTSDASLNDRSSRVEVFDGTAAGDARVEHSNLTMNHDALELALAFIQDRAPLKLTVPLPAPEPTVDVRITGVTNVTVLDATGGIIDSPNFFSPPPQVATFSLATGFQAAHLSSESYRFRFRAPQTPFSVAIVSVDPDPNPLLIRFRDLAIPAGAVVDLLSAGVNGSRLIFDSNHDDIPDREIIPTVRAAGPVARDRNPPALSVQEVSLTGNRVRLILSAADAETGITRLFFSLDGRNYAPYAGPIDVTRGNQQRFFGFADDSAGNRGWIIHDIAGAAIPALTPLAQMLLMIVLAALGGFILHKSM